MNLLLLTSSEVIGFANLLVGLLLLFKSVENVPNLFVQFLVRNIDEVLQKLDHSVEEFFDYSRGFEFDLSFRKL